MAGALASLRSEKSPGAGEQPSATTPPENVEQAYMLYVDSVWGTLRRLGVPAQGLDDAAQDVFMTVHRRWTEFRHASSRRTWIIGIAVRVAANHRRRIVRDAQRKATGEVEGISAEAQPQHNPSAFEHCARREASEFLQSFLDELPDEQREVFTLVDLEQLTVRESAEACGVSFSTCYKRVQIARTRFNEAVKRYRATDTRRLR